MYTENPFYHLLGQQSETADYGGYSAFQCTISQNFLFASTESLNFIANFSWNVYDDDH